MNAPSDNIDVNFGACHSEIMKSRFSLPLSALLLGACAISADALITDPSNGCVVQNPNPRSGESISWSGERRGALAHGTGTVSWFLHGAPNGRYEGMVVNGRMNGTGTAFYPSGNRYVGEFRDGIPDGRGTYILADGREITGDWQAGRWRADD